MTSRNLLKEGTAIRARGPQCDGGDFGERHCPAGSVGFIDMVLPDQECCYSVVFEPSGVTGFWSPEEIARDADVLPPGHPGIPSDQVIRLSRLARDLVYDFGHDHGSQTITVPRSYVEALAAAAAGTPAEDAVRAVFPSMEEVFPDGAVEATVTFEDADRISGAAGYSERLLPHAEEAPAPMSPRR
jgi:hypothetical protein